MSEQTVSTQISKNTVVKSLLWKLMERGGTQGIQFVIQIILARLLCPEDYGVLAILIAFIAMANVFVQSGLNTALIQKRDSDNIDFSSVFWISLLISVLLYAVLFGAAPYIAVFYKNPVLKPVLRVLAFTLFFGALNTIQNAYVSKHMLFKRFFYSSLGGVLGSGAIGILLAYNGFGVWALVVQQLVNNALISVILWSTVKWRPEFVFSLSRTRELFSYGWKLLRSALIDTGYRQLYNLVIGKAFSGVQLGYFSRGEQFPQVIASNIDGSIQSVMLPTLSAVNDDPEEVKRIARRSISMSSFILMPFMFGMAAVAENMVRLLLTDKWLPCVPFVQLSCIAFAFFPINTANLTAINALGRSDVFLKLEIVKKVIGVLIIAVTIPFGLLWMATGRIIGSLISTFINAYPNRKILKYGYTEQWSDILPSFIISIVMGLIVYVVGFLEMPDALLLVMQTVVGVMTYITLAKIVGLDSFRFLIVTVKGLMKR